jgi:hypothetical protein
MRPTLPPEHKFQPLLLTEGKLSRPDNPLIAGPSSAQSKNRLHLGGGRCAMVFSESLRLLVGLSS